MGPTKRPINRPTNCQNDRPIRQRHGRASAAARWRRQKRGGGGGCGVNNNKNKGNGSSGAAGRRWWAARQQGGGNSAAVGIMRRRRLAWQHGGSSSAMGSAMAARRRQPAWQCGGSAASLAAAARWEARRQRGGSGQLGTAAAAQRHQRQHRGGKRSGATWDPYVATEGRVLMTPGGQGPRAGVRQGPGAPWLSTVCRRLSPARLRLGGMCNESGRGEEEDPFTTKAAMSLRRGRHWGDCDGKEDEVEEADNSVTVAALGGVGRQNLRIR